MNTLRFQAELVNGEPRIKAVERNPAKVSKHGVQLFGRSPGPYTIAWYEAPGTPRKRKMLSDYKQAQRFWETKEIQLANGQAWRNEVKEADIASLKRAIELNPDVPLELVASEHAETRKILKGRVSQVEAARYWDKHHPLGLVEKKVREVVSEYLQPKKASKYRRNVVTMLERFSSRFETRPLSDLQGPEIEAWLNSFEHGLRTRRNHRSAVVSLVNFAKLKRYLPKDWDALNEVTNPDPPRPRISIYTPDELLRILNRAETYKAGRKLVPLIAVTAFAGVRHGEMNEELKLDHLEWSDFDWDRKTIYIADEAAKTRDDRELDMPANLIAWLEPYRRASGKICSVVNTSNALCRIRKKAGIEGPRHNALRKSFITYRVALTRNIEAVAYEAGNSVRVIRSNYKRKQNSLRDAAQRWFSIMPTRADVLPLINWKQKRNTEKLSENCQIFGEASESLGGDGARCRV
jgi:integrase